MTSVCPAHISSCGQLFRPVGAHQHSVANGGAAHPDIYIKTSLDADVGHTKNIMCVLHVVVLKSVKSHERLKKNNFSIALQAMLHQAIYFV